MHKSTKFSVKCRLVLLFAWQYQICYSQKPFISKSQIGDCNASCDEYRMTTAFDNNLLKVQFVHLAPCSDKFHVKIDNFKGDTLELVVKDGELKTYGSSGKQSLLKYYELCMCKYQVEVEIAGLVKEPSIVKLDGMYSNSFFGLINEEDYRRYGKRNFVNSTATFLLDKPRKMFAKPYGSYFHPVFSSLGNDTLLSRSDNRLDHVHFPADGIDFTFIEGKLDEIVFEKEFRGKVCGISIGDSYETCIKKLGNPREELVRFKEGYDSDGKPVKWTLRALFYRKEKLNILFDKAGIAYKIYITNSPKDI